MRTSQEGIDAIKAHEALRLDAYLDTGGVWTIGYGHTGDVGRGDSCTEEEAEELLREDLHEAEAAVNQFVEEALTQYQFDALVSLTFNIGVEAFHGSTILRLINRGDIASAALQFPRWCKDNGEVVQGLLNRRKKEQRMFEGLA